MSPISKEPILYATGKVVGQIPVDIDDLLFLGLDVAGAYPKTAPSYVSLRPSKFQHTLPVDFDLLTSPENRSLDFSTKQPVANSESSKTPYSLGLLPNKSADSLSSEDTSSSEADVFSNSLLEASSDSFDTSGEQIMDIDQYIHIGQSYGSVVVQTASSIHSSGLEQQSNQIVSTILKSDGAVEKTGTGPQSMPPSCNASLARAMAKSPNTPATLRQLDIDNYIHIGNPATCLRKMPTERGEPTTVVKYAHRALHSKHNSSIPTFVRRMKPRFWRRCVGTLKSIRFARNQRACAI
ncbi:hypothetical protein K493DRAFT_299295 [Basidiobolus meristosporus CBS 931.73]|uniref:Uncharacterized protein n=1 Tax=Basidiobolus meristosporus CBS 931.73 TaxID=1314790 RepID=A0A1Y1YNM7_9FUNG|nr:hypothetical protein K493DRAFT_299295 [Basidiobolus meristosporus CBS 931.73]|eukprot:ORX99575.1 hypothetical protein K493DRAFT_299295 [Basidiobolus meristosporus CBS 931.73]